MIDPISLGGMLGGGLLRLAPKLIDYWSNGRDQKMELARMDKEIELEKARAKNQQEQAAMQAATQAAQAGAALDMRWGDALVEALRTAQPPVLEDKGSFWINLLNGLNSSVRPILTYWWCVVIYTLHKGLLAWAAVQEKMGAKEMSTVLYTDFDRAVVGSIIGFWFVDRALRTGK